MTDLPVRSITCAPAGICALAGVADRGDSSVANDERLILARRCAGAVDDAHVRERDDRGVDLHERTNLRREGRSAGSRGLRTDRDDSGTDEADGDAKRARNETHCGDRRRRTGLAKTNVTAYLVWRSVRLGPPALQGPRRALTLFPR